MLNIHNKELTATSSLQMELEAKDLPRIELIRFDGDYCKWQYFIKKCKSQLRNKRSFTDDIGMERLRNVLNGDTKHAVTEVGHS